MIQHKVNMVSEPSLQYGGSNSFEEIKTILRELSISSKETDLRMKETDKKIKELSNLFTTQWGKLVEALMAPGCLKLFQRRGIDVTRCLANIIVEREGKKVMEIDLLLVDTGKVVAVEIKTTCRKQDINDHIERLNKIRQYFPEYQPWKIFGAVGALVFTEGSDVYARKNGFFVLKATGEGLVTIQNPPEFQPAVF